MSGLRIGVVLERLGGAGEDVLEEASDSDSLSSSPKRAIVEALPKRREVGKWKQQAAGGEASNALISCNYLTYDRFTLTHLKVTLTQSQ